jgi:hypothetical protein
MVGESYGHTIALAMLPFEEYAETGVLAVMKLAEIVSLNSAQLEMD